MGVVVACDIPMIYASTCNHSIGIVSGMLRSYLLSNPCLNSSQAGESRHYQRCIRALRCAFVVSVREESAGEVKGTGNLYV
jgi:hypothetical protein